MMRHIKLNLKNCLNIGSEDSALDYAFMFSVIESCNMNKLSPRWYIKELVSRLTSKASSNVDKVALLPCFGKRQSRVLADLFSNPKVTVTGHVIVINLNFYWDMTNKVSFRLI